MAVNTNINIPFIPQEGISSQILAAIQAANEHHHNQQQLNLQQQGLQQTGAYQRAQVANAQQDIEVRKRAQDLTAQGLPSEIALRKAQTEAQASQTALNQTMLQQRQEMLGALSPAGGQQAQPAQSAPAPQGGQVQQTSAPMPTAPVGPTAPATNAQPGAPSPGPPPQQGAASDWVGQNIPPHLAGQAQQIIGPLGQLSPDEQSTLAAAAAQGPASMFKAGNISGYYEPFGAAVKDILTKRGAPEPVSEFEKPEKLANPGAQAAIQARINDPRTKPEEVTQLTRLKNLADAAQNNDIAMKQRLIKAEQAAKQGDPDAAGKMMASNQLTLTDLRTRGATPEFVMAASAAAKKYDPTYNVVAADNQAKTAASSANTGFFGNAHSLTDPGGTLDQLLDQGKKLPQGQYPAFNSIKDWEKAAAGKGPIAGYAATVIGVADDYAKVMGGGQGSDTSRSQIADLVKANLSPESRSAAVQAIKGSVHSQTEARMGKNPFMRQMYGDEAAPTATADPAAKFGGVTR